MKWRESLEGLAGIVLAGNFFAMMAYADALRSTYAFVASPLLFYPLAVIDLIAGLALMFAAVWGLFKSRWGR